MALQFRLNGARVQTKCHDSIVSIMVRNISGFKNIASFGLTVASPVSGFWKIGIVKVDNALWCKVMAVARGEDNAGLIGRAGLGGCFQEREDFFSEDKVTYDICSLRSVIELKNRYPLQFISLSRLGVHGRYHYTTNFSSVVNGTYALLKRISNFRSLEANSFAAAAHEGMSPRSNLSQ
jgi:hypothetical protein